VYQRGQSVPRIIRALLKGPTLCFVPGDDWQPELPRVPDPRRAALASLILTLLLVVGGVLLVHVLRHTADLQDCLMSGRTNCAPVAPPADSHG
jgi:hypothetical protein